MSDTRHLDSFFPYKLAVAAEAFSRSLMAVYGKRYGLSREEWRLLFLLAQADALTSLDLSMRTTLDKVQVSRAAQRLEDKGLISRETAPHDRRLKLYRCTPLGQRLFVELRPQVEACAQRILAAMPAEDRTALEGALDSLRAAIDAHTHVRDSTEYQA